MSRCANCSRSVDEGPLHRTNEYGIKGIFWCEPCIQAKEPELYKNIMEDKPGILQDLEDIFYTAPGTTPEASDNAGS